MENGRCLPDDLFGGSLFLNISCGKTFKDKKF
jgi:hypothetical protein